MFLFTNKAFVFVTAIVTFWESVSWDWENIKLLCNNTTCMHAKNGCTAHNSCVAAIERSKEWLPLMAGKVVYVLNCTVIKVLPFYWFVNNFPSLSSTLVVNYENFSSNNNN